MHRPDFEREGLLDGLEKRPREARLRPLERLFDAGVGLDLAPDAKALLRGTFQLVGRADQLEDLPELRAGAAYGAALGRSGD